MKKTFPIILAFAVIFLFFIQSVGTLVESIYILDLMNLNLDTRVLGLLFFFAPVLLIPFFKKFRPQLIWITFALLFLSRGLLPYLDTANRMLASGIATAAVISLFLLMLSAQPRATRHLHFGLWASAGLALAVGLSVLLRTVYFGLDYSLNPAGGWSGILLGLLLGAVLTQLKAGAAPQEERKPAGVTTAILGIFLVLTLVYFAFSAPSVISRWTGVNYTLIVLAVSLLASAWVLLALLRPRILRNIDRRLLLAANLVFTLCLTVTILVHGVPFPPTSSSPAVTVAGPQWWLAIPLALMLLLFPVLFLDLDLFFEHVRQSAPSPRQLVPGLLLGCLVLILLVFANIFSNVWGYIQPVSLFFRGKFWLAYFLPAGGISLLAWLAGKARFADDGEPAGRFSWGWAVLLVGFCLGTLAGALPVKHAQVQSLGRTSITVMTFNIQSANDASAQKSFERQLAVIRKVSPDIVAMQETDTARISLNNNDYVRFYAGSLGYYSYYGPSTVAGTFGTAILSRFPLLNTRSVYTYSDTDEIAVAEAQIDVDGLPITIYDVHPDGSDLAKMTFVKALLQRAQAKPYAIALGDYNLPDTTPEYRVLDDVFINAWTSVYPTKVSPAGVDMSGADRIDHIFVSHSLGVRNPVYLLPPASGSDHPVHWTEILLTVPK
jgi:endonuclease/exonuclease/phosphatase family metal-dependent hydrolase